MNPSTNHSEANNLGIKSILKESKKANPASDEEKHEEKIDDKNSLLNEFKQQCSNIFIFPLDNKENYPGNYDKYLNTTLSHIAQLQKINFEYALEDPDIKRGVPNFFSKKNKSSPSSPQKKLLLLDLDETLIHADFDQKYEDNKEVKYDAIIKFKTKNDLEQIDEIEEEKTEEDEEIQHSVGIFLRNGVNVFLNEVNKHFDVGIFTASIKEYADAVISFLDPDNKLIKYRLYRNNCINFNDSFLIKDLRILKGINLKDVILLDNSMYSFTTQLKNGILINSFYYNKEDIELYNVLGYLLNYILPADDIREVNEQFFNFQQITNDLLNV